MVADPDTFEIAVAGVVPHQRLARRKLTQAHFALGRARALVEAGHQGAAHACEVLSQAVGTEIAAEVQLLESSWSAPKTLARVGPYVLFDVSAVGLGGVMEIEAPLLLRLLAKLSGTALQSAPVTELTRVEEAALGYLALSALAGLRRARLVEDALAPRFLSQTFLRREALAHLSPGAHVMIKALLTVEGFSGVVRLFLPAAALDAAAGRWLDAPGGALPPALQRASTPLLLLAGQGVLTPLERETLARGDLVMLSDLQRADHGLEGRARLQGREGVSLVGTLTHQGLRVQHCDLPIQPFPPNNEELPMPPTDKTITEILPIQVEVELARVQVTLGELAACMPGFILPLPPAPGGHVVLRVGGRAVAKAELVDVEGQLAARVISLAG